MTNVIDPKQCTGAEAALNVREYSFNALETGEDEGRIFADSYEEAAQLWALENLEDGARRLLQVWDRGEARDFRVERDGNTATAETFTAEWCG